MCLTRVKSLSRKIQLGIMEKTKNFSNASLIVLFVDGIPESKKKIFLHKE